ncbi:MAG TPA: FAD-binding oxidoreductase [Ignavibacteriaceae bacterium]|nr:FAD-binding oxidoreductase [Ignavibacteriaceae bacterium]
MLIKTDQEEIQNFLNDASNYKGNCEAVYFPENKEELKSILKEANLSKKKVTVSGNGTGLTGARVPQGGIVISTEKLNKIIEINTRNGYAIVEPAVLLTEFLSELKTSGYFYPPDPTEKNCFIGGTVATNASGAKTFKYGPTRSFVEELEVILPNGDELYLVRGKNPARDYVLNLSSVNANNYTLKLPQYKLPLTKNAAGYFTSSNADAIDLFVGSEGTLGIFTQVKLRIIPLPEKVISAVFFFTKEMDALKFIDDARIISYNARRNNLKDELDALALEFFDRNALKFLKSDFPNLPTDSEAAVWIEQEADTANEDKLLEKWTSILLAHNGNEASVWFATDDKERDKISEFRHAVSANVNEYISRNNFKKLGTDIAVPDDMFISFYIEIKQMAVYSKLNYLTYGHFGNSHIHLNILPKNPKEYEAGRKLYMDICDKAVAYNGTISAEHGVGKLKREYLERMIGKEVIGQMRELKKTLDPNYILCTGNIFNE